MLFWLEKCPSVPFPSLLPVVGLRAVGLLWFGLWLVYVLFVARYLLGVQTVPVVDPKQVLPCTVNPHPISN